MLAAQIDLPRPPAPADYPFTGFNWEAPTLDVSRQAGQKMSSEATQQCGFLFLTRADAVLLALSKCVRSSEEVIVSWQ